MSWDAPGTLDYAIHHHSHHLELADPPGKFIAHTNLGLAFGLKVRGDNNGTRCGHRWLSVALSAGHV